MLSKFEFYEIVKVISNKPDLKKFKEQEGPVGGKTEENGSWFYGVILQDFLYSFNEADIVSTGKFANYLDYKPLKKVRVMPNGQIKLLKMKSGMKFNWPL
ncbi:MAG: Immunity protein 31 [Francisellaceae bacterium]|nr:Immunity protein 31 [Francisellaceae bacterium]